MGSPELNRSEAGQLNFGALVVSLDFELHWGVRDHCPANGPYRENLLGARTAIPRILELFEAFGIAATWATVGFLFAASRRERESFQPTIRPKYQNSLLDPYQEPIGEGEEESPLHFAPSLIEHIRNRPQQEIATQTFSHYYCLEPGATRTAFEADLHSAVAIAQTHGIRLRSIVFPRNQFNPGYADLLLGSGIVCYRGNPSGWIYRPRPRSQETMPLRGCRLIDHYVNLSGPKITRWSDVIESNGLCNIPASMFLRPYSPRWSRLEALRLNRIAHSIRAAAIHRGIFHLWWHPHNFGSHTDENLKFLRTIFRIFARYRESHGMRSLSMAGVAELVREPPTKANAGEQSVTELSDLEHAL